MFVFAGEPVIVIDGIKVVIDCGQLIDQAISDGIRNPSVTWIKKGVMLLNGSAANVVTSADRRRLIIIYTLLAVGGQSGNSGNYTCDIVQIQTVVQQLLSVFVVSTCNAYPYY